MRPTSTRSPLRTLVLRHWRIVLQAPSEALSGDLSVVLHTLEGGYLAMPLRRVLNASTILQPTRGILSAQVDRKVVQVSPGERLLVPRGSWHTFWNAGESPIEFQEISAPGGIDRYYEALAPLIPEGGRADVDRVFALSDPHGLEFDLGSLVDLIESHHVRLA